MKTGPIVYTLTLGIVLVGLWSTLWVDTDPAEPEPIAETTEATETTEASTQTNTDIIEGNDPIDPIDPHSIELIARTIWGEAGGIPNTTEQAAVAWCILNRVDATGKSIEEVVTAPRQFVGYRPNGEVPEEFLQLAEDVLTRWHMEQMGFEFVGRVLPADYLYFIGDGKHNYYSREWQAADYWDWSLKTPYK